MNEFTTSQFARQIGRSRDTVIRWRKEGTLVPQRTREAGKLTIYLYTDDDVHAAKALIAERETGVKRAP